jgi:hypothetical protein
MKSHEFSANIAILILLLFTIWALTTGHPVYAGFSFAISLLIALAKYI